MSSGSSIPTLMRTTPGSTPASSSCCSVSWAWVVDAGWMTRVFASPMLARWLARFTDSMNFWPPSRPPFTTKENTEPGPFGRYFFARSKCGCSGSPAQNTFSMRGSASSHSATKFLGGAGTTLGGVVVESGRFHWANEHFPLFDQPVPSYGGLNWHGNFGEYAFLTRLRAEQLRDIGPALSPHSAWLLATGVETLPFRLQAHVDNAKIVAEWLDADPRIEFVNWAGLPAHPHHDRAKKYLPKGPGSVFSFGVKGGREVGQRFIESVNLASHLANIGDAKTLVIHPASTTHAQLTETQLLEAGVLPGLVRISVGIEDPEDIVYDLDQALTIAVKG